MRELFESLVESAKRHCPFYHPSVRGRRGALRGALVGVVGV